MRSEDAIPVYSLSMDLTVGNTTVFVLLITMPMSLRLRKINMAEALKSIE